MGPALPCPYSHLRSLVHKSIGGIGEEPSTASCPRAGSMRKVTVMWIFILQFLIFQPPGKVPPSALQHESAPN